MVDTSYQNKEANYFEDRREEMHPFIPNAASTLLEVGCGNGAFAANLKMVRNIHVTAIEPHPPAAEAARRRLDRVFCGSVESQLPMIESERFDCIVLNDVLEHLVDPWEELRLLRSLLSPDGVVVASIPNVRYLPVLKDYVLRAQWQYRDFGVLDRTHLRFFTKSGMEDLFRASGYQLDSITGINPLKFSWKMKLIDTAVGGRIADARFKQFACVARSAAGPVEAARQS